MKYVSDMNYEDMPDYAKIRKIFLDGLKSEGVKLDAPLSFTKPLEPQNGEARKSMYQVTFLSINSINSKMNSIFF